MIYLLDTNTCIQLWQRNNARVRAHFSACSPSDVSLCSVVKAELLFGALNSQNKVANTALLKKLFAPLHSFEFDDTAAHCYAEIRMDLSARGKIIGANDLMIAAIAMANQLTIVTHNTSEFSRVQNLSIEDWE